MARPLISKKLIAALKSEFPGKNVFPSPPDAPTEVVIEISKTRRKSVAISVIGRSPTHYHRKLTECYEVLSGVLELQCGDETIRLQNGDKAVIDPGTRHGSRGVNGLARVRVTCSPPWTPEDYIIR